MYQMHFLISEIFFDIPYFWLLVGSYFNQCMLMNVSLYYKACGNCNFVLKTDISKSSCSWTFAVPLSLVMNDIPNSRAVGI